MTDRAWTISVLTIPGRERYLEQLVDSLATARVFRRAELNIVYNWRSAEAPRAIESRLRRLAPNVPLVLSFNYTDPSIAAGRQQQLNACRTPLICFLDDDVTVHGDLLDTLDSAMAKTPLALTSVPSRVGDSDEHFKPRADTPGVDRGPLRFTSVQGMLAAGYRQLFLDVGGFAPTRRYWGEWTELNLRLWRLGLPTAYVMDGAFLRHWEDAPCSPTRNREGREAEILWGLVCTALEYDAVTLSPSTSEFWRLAIERYLTSAFGSAVSPQRLLSAVLGLVPRLTSEWPWIDEARKRAAAHPFPFPPFAALTADDVDRVCGHARDRVAVYRRDLPSAKGRRLPPIVARAMARLRLA